MSHYRVCRLETSVIWGDHQVRYVWGGDAHGWTWIADRANTYSAADAVALALELQSEYAGERVYVEEVL